MTVCACFSMWRFINNGMHREFFFLNLYFCILTTVRCTLKCIISSKDKLTTSMVFLHHETSTVSEPGQQMSSTVTSHWEACKSWPPRHTSDYPLDSGRNTQTAAKSLSPATVCILKGNEYMIDFPPFIQRGTTCDFVCFSTH